jgi:hypothetical protein
MNPELDKFYNKSVFLVKPIKLLESQPMCINRNEDKPPMQTRNVPDKNSKSLNTNTSIITAEPRTKK